jgi:hypothetical protein
MLLTRGRWSCGRCGETIDNRGRRLDGSVRCQRAVHGFRQCSLTEGHPRHCIAADPIGAVRADEVRVGDIIDWCGRRMPVMEIQPKVSAGGRAGRWFTVEIDGEPRRLHWWDHERVGPNVRTPHQPETDGDADA